MGAQSFVFTTADSAQSTITVDGATAGIDAATLVTQLNEKLRAAGLAAAASLQDVSGALSLRIDSLHDLIDVSATLNGASFDPVLQAPGVWAAGGLPAANAGQPFGDGVRTMAVVGVRPKVAGNSRLMPASGPSPGSMPTMVPTMQPSTA